MPKAIGVDANRLAAKIAAELHRLESKEAPMRAWVYQRGQAFYVGWREPNGRKRGKSCGEGRVGEKLAEKERERIHAELVTGLYGSNLGKTWAEFRTEYTSKIVHLKES